MSKNIVIGGNTFNGVSTIKAQNAGGVGTSSFVDLSELEPTITITANQVVTQDPLVIQLTTSQYDTISALTKDDVVIWDATALQLGTLKTIIYSSTANPIEFSYAYGYDVDIATHGAAMVQIVVDATSERATVNFYEYMFSLSDSDARAADVLYGKVAYGVINSGGDKGQITGTVATYDGTVITT